MDWTDEEFEATKRHSAERREAKENATNVIKDAHKYNLAQLNATLCSLSEFLNRRELFVEACDWVAVEEPNSVDLKTWKERHDLADTGRMEDKINQLNEREKSLMLKILQERSI